MTPAPTFDSNMNPGSIQLKEVAPGAKTGRICGILAIVLALTCVGIPIAIILGIVAIVKTSKARSLARNYPDSYEIPSSAGLILGIVGLCLPIVMLPVAGIASAIAIPALLSQRARARDHALLFQWGQVRSRAEALALESGASGGHPLTGDEAIHRLLQDPALSALKNTQQPGDAVLIRGTEPRPGTIALSPEAEETAAGTTWFLVMKASFGPAHALSLREEKIELGTVPPSPGSSLVIAPDPRP
ncbi:MAG: hypothetical protein KGN80_05965 [Acidobacteriota bacterium]|nr:hypothetical protein [Acidobacteriota bacterium]